MIIVDTTHPANKNLTTTNQSDFGNSAHKSFTSVPSGYKAVATTDQAGFEGQAITIVKEK